MFAVAREATRYVANWKIKVFGPRAASSNVLANLPMLIVSIKDIRGSPRGMASAGPANMSMAVSIARFRPHLLSTGRSPSSADWACSVKLLQSMIHVDCGFYIPTRGARGDCLQTCVETLLRTKTR